MKKILVQYIDDKFINNIKLSDTNFCEKIIIDTKNRLYQIYYEYGFTDIIFIDSLLGDEEKQFINEFGNNINIYIYQNTKSNNYIHTNTKLLKGILSKIRNDNSNYRTIHISKLVNYDIFFMDKTQTKQNTIISFLDNIEALPKELNEYLYPNSTLPIKLFNNSSIIHPQNLGLLSEIDKASILQQSKYYLVLDGSEDYIPEAWSCGCSVLCYEDLTSLIPTKYKHSENFRSYSNFLKELFRDKK
jgi:hypothetical protein